MGFASKHFDLDQRGDRPISKHHLSIDLLDGRLHHRFHTRWSVIRHLRTKIVFHHSFLGLIGNIIGASAQSINMLVVTNVRNTGHR
jgi:hypothetical protein